MTEKFKQALNLSVGIPMWSIVCALLGGAYFGGMTLQKLNALLDSYSETRQLVNSMNEKQFGQIADTRVLQDQQRDHERRITVLERAQPIRIMK